jgi:hypothetical protein
VFIALAALTIIGGTVCAMSAAQIPRHRPMLERWGGGLLLCGFACLGLALPMV